MLPTQPNDFTTLELATERIDVLQNRLILCEQVLDDMVRSLEIATATGQLSLISSFVRSAEDYLTDRMDLAGENAMSNDDQG
jgi:hypothetical protein